MRNLIVAALLVGVGVFGFLHQPGHHRPTPIPDAAPGASPTAPRPMGQNVIAYHVGDESIEAARRKAHATLPRFRELIAADLPATYTVKFSLTQNGETEHIWMQLIRERDGVFSGLLANVPENGDEYKKGDPISVAEADVEDWMVRTSSEMYGGYTVRAMLKDIPQKDADKYRKMFRD